MARHRRGQGLRVWIIGVSERQQFGRGTLWQWRQLGLGQRRVGAGGSAHSLGGIVDQDVQRPGLGDGVGQTDHLCRIAQVDAHHPQPVQPVARIGQAGEPPHGIAGKPCGDRRVGAVAKQAQSDVHADLGPAAGEQGAPAGEIGAGLAFGMTQQRAVRTQLVVERVDVGVVLFADVAGTRSQQSARARCRRRGGQRDPAGFVIDSVGSTGRGRGDNRAVGVGDRRPPLQSSGLLHRLEHVGGRMPHGDEIGMALVEEVQLGQDGQCHLQPFGVDAARSRGLPIKTHARVYRRPRRRVLGTSWSETTRGHHPREHRQARLSARRGCGGLPRLE